MLTPVAAVAPAQKLSDGGSAGPPQCTNPETGEDRPAPRMTGPEMVVKVQRFSEQASQRELPSAPQSHAGPVVGAFWMALWASLGAHAVVGLARHRARLRAHTRQRALEDADVRRIIATGVFSSYVDEPTDLTRVEEEERRFWAQVL